MTSPRGIVLLLLLAGTLWDISWAKRRGEKSKRDRTREAEKSQKDINPGVSQPPFNISSPVAYAVEVINRYEHPKPGDVQVGCKELRSKRYISDGFCTSTKPITEVVCTGHCLPIRNLPWYAEFIKVWARTKVLEWRCVEDVVKRRRVRLLCENSESRTYKIKVVKSCKCKRYMRQQNQSLVNVRKRRRKQRKMNRSRRRNLADREL